VGKYLPTEGSFSQYDCINCEAGKYQLFAGQAQCEECSSGTYSAEMAEFCTACPPGTHSSTESSTGCSECTVGRYTSSPGSITCPYCQWGKYNVGAANVGCMFCDTGKYLVFDVWDTERECRACPAGKFSVLGETICRTCDVGFVSNNPEGTSFCEPCDAGKFSSADAKTCLGCEAGFWSGLASNSCTECSDGSVSAQNSSLCSTCSAGFFASANKTKCEPCPVGFWSGQGATSCTACEVGKFNTALNSTGCSWCTDDAVRGSTTDLAASNSSSQCRCNAGFFESSQSCEAVGEGMDSETKGMTTSLLKIEKGYWRTGAASLNILQCQNEEHCLGGTDPNNYCAEGYGGPLCSVCMDDFSAVGAGEGLSCKKCEGSATATVVVGITVLLLLFSLIVRFILKKDKTESRLSRASKKLENKLGRAEPVIKIVFAYFQVVGGLGLIFGIQFPPVYSTVISFLSGVFSFDFISFMPIGCIFPSSHYTLLLSYTLVPLSLSIMLVGWYNKLKKETDEKSISLRNTLFELFLALTFLLLPSISVKVFTTFACQEFDDGTSFLKVDFSLDCQSPEHTFYKTFAGLMVCVYPVGIPLMYFILLFRTRQQLKAGQVKKEKEMSRDSALEEALKKREENEEKDKTVKALSFLYDSYQPKFWWFEIFETLRKLALTGFLVFIAPGTTAQVVVSLVMSIVALVVYALTQPFVDNFNNYLALVANSQLVLTLVCALAIKVNMDGVNQKDQASFDAFLTALQFVPVLLLSGFSFVMAKKARKDQGNKHSSVVPVGDVES